MGTPSYLIQNASPNLSFLPPAPALHKIPSHGHAALCRFRTPGVRLIGEMAQEDLHAVVKNCFAVVNSSVSEGMSAAILEVVMELLSWKVEIGTCLSPPFLFMEGTSSRLRELSSVQQLRFFFFLFWATLQYMKFPGWGSDPSHSCDLRCCHGNTGALTRCSCAGWGFEPLSQCSRDTANPIAPLRELPKVVLKFYLWLQNALFFLIAISPCLLQNGIKLELCCLTDPPSSFRGEVAEAMKVRDIGWRYVL